MELWDVLADGLVQFYQLTDATEKAAFIEYDKQALAMSERALAALKLPDTADWPNHLPVGELTEPQLRQVREDVDRVRLLRWGLKLKTTFLRTDDAAAVTAAYRDIVASIDRDESKSFKAEYDCGSPAPASSHSLRPESAMAFHASKFGVPLWIALRSAT